ncbi:acyl-CoA dehydrogenase [Nocardiopsis sp. SBT366]|uniref:acyl-CoA dehydrogenase n=1 Tax=Nocardiopsis sp. SBT366 TaxID=1580529 RepID=UPI000AF05D78|nr:acyl-CoA dehydrogenase [Nocardiopsis sp. SBT366]
MSQSTPPAPVNGRERTREEDVPEQHRRRVAASFARAVRSGDLDLPLPGGGDTRRRWRVLRDLAREDLSLARLAEGHVDAMAILAELGAAPPRHGQLWGVWAAHPPGPNVTARTVDGSWRLSGVKPFCSGARTCTHALVSAEVDQGERRLFAVATAGAGPVGGTWASAGMAASDTLTFGFDDVPAEAVGSPGAYVRRPGFHHGGAGVAACWLGGAVAVSAPLAARAARETADVHTRTAWGSVDRDLHAAAAVLGRAADEIDADPEDALERAAPRTARARAVVAGVCGDVLRRTGEALGAGPPAADPEYARAAADLAVYLRQHHADRDLAELGGLSATKEDVPHEF